VLLIYNPDSDSYEGPEASVPRWLFDEAVDELVEGGLSEAAARSRLLDESEWSNVEGVEDLAPRCLHCRVEVAPGRRFCSVVCEAAFIADVHS